MGLKLKAEWKNSSKRLLAAGLSLAMIGGMLDLSASVAAAQTTEPQAAVAASEPLTEGIQEQQSPFMTVQMAALRRVVVRLQNIPTTGPIWHRVIPILLEPPVTVHVHIRVYRLQYKELTQSIPDRRWNAV